VLSKLDSGETVENLSRQYDCSIESILGWKARRDANPEHWKPAQQAIAPGGDKTALRRAMEALGNKPSDDVTTPEEAPSQGVGEAPSVEPTPASNSEPKISAPPLTAENLPNIIEGIDRMIMNGIAVAKAKGVPRQVVMEAMAMPASDKETLAFFAPYALEYADVVMQYAKPAMAGLFVLFWGMSITGRAKDLGALSKQYQAWAEAQKGQHRAGEESNGKADH
jgi:hypothetical protein